MKFILIAALSLALMQPALAADPQLNLLQPAAPSAQSADSATGSAQSQDQTQLQQTSSQQDALQLIGDDFDTADEAEFDWSLWAPWLAVSVVLLLGLTLWQLGSRKA
jgi:hypothetical protein